LTVQKCRFDAEHPFCPKKFSAQVSSLYCFTAMQSRSKFFRANRESQVQNHTTGRLFVRFILDRNKPVIYDETSFLKKRQLIKFL